MLINNCEIDISKFKTTIINNESFFVRIYRKKETLFNELKCSCNKCGVIKKFSEFVKDKNRFLGNYWCRECNNSYNNNYQKVYQKTDKAKAYRKKMDQKQALFKTYSHQLTIDEGVRLNEDGKTLEVKCTYCGKHYRPTKRSVIDRISAIKTIRQGECRLYCSDECKSECPVFGSQGVNHTSPKLTREIVPAMRQAVLKRDGYECQKCGSTKSLHCHHIVPHKADPGMTEDTDNCITFCRKCHYEIHGLIDGCGLGDLRMMEEKC